MPHPTSSTSQAPPAGTSASCPEASDGTEGFGALFAVELATTAVSDAASPFGALFALGAASVSGAAQWKEPSGVATRAPPESASQILRAMLRSTRKCWPNDFLALTSVMGAKIRKG